MASTQDGSIYYACATPPGSRAAAWQSLGALGRIQARRLRDEFVTEVRRGRVRESTRGHRNATFAEVADAWLAARAALVDVGELAQRTFDGYELSVRRHLRPFFGSRPLRAIAPNDLVAWHAAQRRSAAAAQRRGRSRAAGTRCAAYSPTRSAPTCSMSTPPTR